MKSVFVNVVERLVKVGDETGIDMDVETMRVLARVIKGDKDGDPLNVTDVMQDKSIASPATVHKRIQALIQGGFLQARPVPLGYPKKELVLTTKGKSLIKKLDGQVRAGAKA